MANSYILGCSQFGKLKGCKSIGVEDRISDLPDEILLHILDCLTLKEAVATGILSKRWKNLWASCSNLDFGCFQEPDLFKYIVIVERILRQNNAPKLRKLRIVHRLVQDFAHHIDDWISFAVRRGVSELELNFNYLYSKGHWDQYYVHAHVLAAEHFDSLTDLCLRSVNLSDEVFDLILSKCCSLERFLLMFNDGLVNAKNTAPHLKLKSLEVYLCSDLEYLRLLVPNLISFKYQGKKRAICIKDAKHLASLRLSTTFACPDIFAGGSYFLFSQFSCYLSKLESLVVSSSLLEGLACFIKLDAAFSNLKQLKLEVDHEYSVSCSYEVAASIIRVAPFLELFEIILPTYDRRRRFRALELGSMSPHQNLKEVKLIGFRGDGDTMEFLHYLALYAVSLQKIGITALGAIRIGDGLRMEHLADRKAKHCNKCVLQLRQTLHPNVQLHVS